MKRCKHDRVRFIGMITYRGYPEKISICRECGMTIADFVTDDDFEKKSFSDDYQTEEPRDFYHQYFEPRDRRYNEFI